MIDRLEGLVVRVNRWLLILMLGAMACIIFANVVPVSYTHLTLPTSDLV